MKTILLVSNSFPFGIAEASFLRPEIRALSRNFHICIVARNVRDAQTTSLPENVSVVRYDAKSGYNVGKLFLQTLLCKEFYRELAALCRRKALRLYKLRALARYCMRAIHFKQFLEPVRAQLPESVILYTYWNDYSVFSLSMLKRRNDKLVSRLHRHDLYLTEKNRFYLPMKALSNQKADLLAFISEQGKRYYQETFDANAPAKVCYLGVKPQKKRAPFHKKEALHILSFSYLSPVKRVDRIVNCLEKIENTQVHWVHIGDGTEKQNVLEAAKTRLSVKKNITYTFLGAMENEDALRYISENEFDFLLNVSASEGIPVTMMECMSFGIPVIATQVGGVSELVEDGKNGYLLSPDFTEDEFLAAVSRYRDLPYANKQDLRENAYQSWKNKFNEEINISKFSQTLNNL